MKSKQLLVGTLIAAVLLGTLAVFAADAVAKTYQVTGPVVEVTPITITVQKGEEKWQVSRAKETKVTGDLKVGAKATIYYRMVATDVDVKK
jgi:heme/copper-type cytochrome/quinol oxidase subunit 2